jgi:hypothetical protein
MNPIALYRGLSPTMKWVLQTVFLVAIIVLAGHFAGPHVALAVTALSTTNPTLSDAYRERNPKGGLLPIIKSLEQLYPFVKDATWMECNDGTRHKILSENALPTPTYRGYNEGVAASKDRTQVVAEVTAMAATMSKIDVDLVKLNGAEYRARRIGQHLRGQLFDLESKCFYSNFQTSPKQFHGLFPRLSATTLTPAGNQVLKIDAAPSGNDQASVALVGWGPESVYMCYPEGSTAGVDHKDMGEQIVKDAGGTNEFLGYVDWIQMTGGFAVANYRYVGRACNIDTSAISGTGTNVLDAFDALYDQCETSDTSVRWVYYVPRTLRKYARLQAKNAIKNSTLSIEMIADAGTGRPTPFLMANGIPVRASDGLTITESVVS